MKSAHFILPVIFFLSSFIVAGQNESSPLKRRCPVKTINFENGLLNNATTNIITDVFGFTWVSTKTGLQRFNGYTLETITPVINHDTLNINYPVHFFGLEDGSIWITCKEGILEYDPATNSFRLAISFRSTINLRYAIIPLKETPNGVWCMQENKGIVIYNRKGILTDQYSFFDLKIINGILKSQQTQYVNSITTNDKYIFINSAATKNILSVNTITREFSCMNFPGGNILDLTCIHDKLYILSDVKMWFIDVNNNKITKSIDLREITNENVTTGSLGCTGNNQVLISVNSHLFELDTNCVYHYEITDLNKNPVVSTGFIFQIYVDKFSRIWLLTNNDIKRIQNVEIAFAHFIYTGEKNNFVKAIYFDEQKNILIAGCFNGGIQLYDTLANPLWKRPLVTPEVKDILAIEKLNGDEYLVVTFGRGWYLLNLSKRQIKPLPINVTVETKLQPEQTNFSNNLQRINDTTVFIATASNVFRCIFYGSRLISAEPLLPLNGNSTIDCFIYSEDKILWAGTNTGLLYRLNKTGYLQTINIPNNYLVRSIAEDEQHNIWVGTDKGLYIYSNLAVLIKKVTRETGLLNDCIYSILPVTKTTAVFAGSNLGLSFISLNDTIKNFTKEMGLQENEFNTGSSFKSSNGKLYFGGINGITAFYPAAFSAIRDTPVLNITRLVIDDSLYNSSAGSWQGDSVLLNYKQNHLRFDLAAMGLLNAYEYVYRYRMDGFEKQWQTTYQPTGINYILQPGKYTLEIICHPVLSPGNTFYKKFIIIIYPPWWQSWWFRILSVAVMVVIIFLMVYLYSRNKYLKKIRLLQSRQEIQVERERISRDLHDNLGAYAAAIMANVDEMIDNNKVNEITFGHLKNNAREIMINIRDTIWALNKEKISVTGISDHFKGYVQKISPSYPDIKFEVIETITNDNLLSPVQGLNIFRIMQEAFTNALKHSHCNEINISIISDKTFLITISDDGEGIDKNNLYKGNGIKNMYSRAKESGLFFIINNKEKSGTEVILSSQNSTIN